MTKVKSQAVNEEKLSPEEQAYLDAQTKDTSFGASIPSLAINIATEDNDGNDIPPKTFTLLGSGEYSKTIRFRPFEFRNKLIAMKQDGTKWKTTAETIFFEGNQQPIDNVGGVACGRLLGRAIPPNWTETQKQTNSKKATWYGFLFGLAEFPGKDPVLCNLRLPAAKAKQIADALTEVKKVGLPIYYMLDMKLVSNKRDKSKPHPDIEITPDLSAKLPLSGTGEYLTTIKEYIDSHNVRIREEHQRVKMARNQEVEAEEIVDDVLEYDEIPF